MSTTGTLLALSDNEFIDQASYELDKQQRRKLRFDALGFQPQTEVRVNQLLPYGSQEALDAESQLHLAAIKAGLARAVACRELQPSLWLWLDRLAK